MTRDKCRQIWADELFVSKLEKLKAQRALLGKPIRNTGQLTKEIVEAESFKEIEKELLSLENIMYKIKYDRNI